MGRYSWEIISVAEPEPEPEPPGAATFRAEPEPIFFGSEPEPPVLRRLWLHLLGKQKSRAVDPDPHGSRRVNLSTKN